MAVEGAAAGVMEALWFDVRVAYGVAGTAWLLCGLGRRLMGPATPAEAALVAGWGAMCLVMTACAVTRAIPLAVPAALLAGVALMAVRPPGWRLVVLTLPLWLVMLGARPSQVDTWLNLLPNLAYLSDHGGLPADGAAASWSFLPGAPYNTQFAGYAIGLLAGGLVVNALSLFNVVLLCAAGMHLARVCAGERPAGWWAMAAGLLLAVPANPGFVPRVFFASYGEAPIAVTLMFAVALGADLFAAARAGVWSRASLAGLALVLAALVEIKQSALGLVVPFSASLLALGLVAPGMRRWRWALSVAAATAPSVGLYVLWRWYVLRHFAVGELKMLPVAAWHLDLLGPILRGIAFAIWQKATYFMAVIVLLGAAVVQARRAPWERAFAVLVLGAGLMAGFNVFLLFTYVAHFPAVWAVHAHSYFRYMSQLSLVVMLGLATWWRPVVAGWLEGQSPGLRRRAAAGAVALLVAMPVAGVRLLRFDQDAPQPFLWDMAHRSAARLQDDDRVALVVPGDGDDAVGSLLRGVMLFTEPRRPRLDFQMVAQATPQALEAARKAGFTRALVICAKEGLEELPRGGAGLLAFAEGSWRADLVFQTPPELSRARFSAMLPKNALCLP